MTEQQTAQVDAWLQRPDVRLTRAFKPGEWATAQDLLGALELDVDQRAAYQRELARLVACGNVKLQPGATPRYLLVREPTPPPPEVIRAKPHEHGFEGEERNGYFFWRGSWRAS